jgi:vacuolar-type H+-ATPase subunit I/STV1
MKEIVIPITGESFVKIILLIVLCCVIIGTINGLVVHNADYVIFYSIFGGFTMVFFSMLASFIYEWDLNPAHAIGYCIRFKQEWEKKKEIST